jgi:hypothetical protein
MSGFNSASIAITFGSTYTLNMTLSF